MTLSGAGEEECSFGRDRTCQCGQKIWCLIGVTARAAQYEREGQSLTFTLRFTTGVL